MLKFRVIFFLVTFLSTIEAVLLKNVVSTKVRRMRAVGAVHQLLRLCSVSCIRLFNYDFLVFFFLDYQYSSVDLCWPDKRYPRTLGSAVQVHACAENPTRAAWGSLQTLSRRPQ